jgi:hypothetical protein
MSYKLEISNNIGQRIETLGPFGNVPSARQAMLDHSNTTDLPTEDPWHGPECGVLEGWFVGATEYCIIHT